MAMMSFPTTQNLEDETPVTDPRIVAIREYAEWMWRKGEKLADGRNFKTQENKAAACLKVILGRKPTEDEIKALTR